MLRFCAIRLFAERPFAERLFAERLFAERLTGALRLDGMIGVAMLVGVTLGRGFAGVRRLLGVRRFVRSVLMLRLVRLIAVALRRVRLPVRLGGFVAALVLLEAVLMRELRIGFLGVRRRAVMPIGRGLFERLGANMIAPAVRRVTPRTAIAPAAMSAVTAPTAVVATTAAAGAAIGFILGVAVRTLFLGDQRLPVGDRNLIVVRMDFRERQEAVAVAAVVDESRLE